MRLAFAVLAVLCSTARADDASPLVFKVGASGRYWHDHTRENDDPADHPESGPAAGVDALVAVRVYPGLSLGLRFGASWERYHLFYPGTHSFHDLKYTVVPFDIGATALYRFDRFWIAPWLGVHTEVTAEADTMCTPNPDLTFVCTRRPDDDLPTSIGRNVLAIGVAGGVELVRGVSVYVEGQAEVGNYASVGLGLAFTLH